MVGSLGNDTYFVDNVGDTVTEGAVTGIDTVNSSVDFILGANVENLILTGTGTSGTGNALGNEITGNGFDNNLSGLAGEDTIVGSGGSDSITGGADNDTMTGGSSTDTFIVGTDAIGDTDHITDFEANIGDEDVLDIASLLSGFGGSTLADAIADGFVRISDDGTNTTIEVDNDGSTVVIDPFATNYTVVLDNTVEDVTSLANNINVS